MNVCRAPCEPLELHFLPFPPWEEPTRIPARAALYFWCFGHFWEQGCLWLPPRLQWHLIKVADTQAGILMPFSPLSSLLSEGSATSPTSLTYLLLESSRHEWIHFSTSWATIQRQGKWKWLLNCTSPWPELLFTQRLGLMILKVFSNLNSVKITQGKKG